MGQSDDEERSNRTRVWANNHAQNADDVHRGLIGPDRGATPGIYAYVHGESLNHDGIRPDNCCRDAAFEPTVCEAGLVSVCE